jgi:hypothetical protein
MVERGQSDSEISAIARDLPRRDALRRIGAGGVAAGLLGILATRQGHAQDSLSTASTEASARRAINAINQALASGDMSLLDFAFDASYVNHTPRVSRQTGQLFPPDLAGLEAALDELRSAAPNAVIIVDDVVASGDTAAVLVTLRGTLDPNVIPFPAEANPRFSVGGMAFARVVDGRVVESWDYSETLQLAQLPAAPTPTPSPEPTAPPTTVPPATPGQVREVSDFQELALDGIGTLLLQQGDVESLTIEAEEKVLNRIETEVRRGQLIIRPDRSFRTNEPITYYLTARRLTSIDVSGSARVEGTDFTADTLHLSATGSSSIAISNLTATVLDAEGAGSAAFELGGAVDEQKVALNGTGNYAAPNLVSRVATVTTDAASQATVQVTESLNASAGGASSITYLGNPQIQQQTSAAGRIVAG